MKIKDLFNSEKPVISLEVFPPKADTPIETVFDALEKFKVLKPDYISVTYGAGGSQKGRTVEIVSKIKNDYNIESMAHFTCVGHTVEEIDGLLESLKQNGIENILALRGDPPANQPDFDFSKNVFKHAYELIRHIRSRNKDLCIAAAAYLEGHPQCRTIKEDMLHLKEKVDTGVDFLVTQLFFDNRLFYEFQDKAAQLNINCPITAGIMPIFNSRIKTMTATSGCSIPAKLVLMIDKYQDSPEDLLKAGIEFASTQILDLIENGVDGIHLYTMNRPKSSSEILCNARIIEQNHEAVL